MAFIEHFFHIGAQAGFVFFYAKSVFPASKYLYGIGPETVQVPAQRQAGAVDAAQRNFAVDVALAADQLQVKAFNLEQFCYRNRFGKLQTSPPSAYFFFTGLIKP